MNEHSLSPEEHRVIRAIRAHAKEQAGSAGLIVITDAGRDHDDELALIVLRGLERLGIGRLKAVVVNLSGDDQRARLVKGALGALQFSEDVPVAVGSNDDPGYVPEPYEFHARYIAPAHSVETDGQALLKSEFGRASTQGERLTLVVLSGMTDARDFIRDNPALAQRLIAKASLMGGVQTRDGLLALDDHGYFLPDSAYNNTVDKHLNPDPDAGPAGPSARQLYAMLQRMDVPMEVVTRNAAYAAPVSPEFYEQLASSGHPVAQRLLRDQRAAVENLWESVRRGDHERLTPDWFYQTFTNDRESAKPELERHPSNPWKIVEKLNLYDPIAVIAAVAPEALGLFVPEHHRQHRIIGISQEKHGIADPDRLRAVISALAKVGLGANIDWGT